MPPVRTKAPLPVGSAQWVQDENRQISQFGIQEIEDFNFSARNEVEWLNEHMADIFSKNQVNVTEIFKTPGKLRGKTPRTNRKQNPLQIRQPLTDIFSTNASLNVNPSPPKTLKREVSKFRVAEDPRDSTLPSKASQQNTDSGYHGSEDDMDVGQMDAIAPQILAVEQKQTSLAPEKYPARAREASTGFVEEQRTTEGSFHSAKEDMTGLEISKEPSEPAVEENASNDPEPEVLLQSIPGSFPPQNLATESIPEDPMDLVGIDNDSALEDNNSIDVLGSASEGSSPVKLLIRKSSLTFAALPAREPLTTKKSIGSRVSGTAHLDQSRATIGRGSFLGRYTGGKSLGGNRQPDHANNGLEDSMDVDQSEMPHLSREESDGDKKMARLHNKSSTQRLHEKINMLGKSQPARPTKSIPAAAIITHPIYPDLPHFDAQPPTSEQPSSKSVAANGPDDVDDDDDWIQPPQSQAKDLRQQQLPKSTSTDIVENSKGKGKMYDQQPGLGNHDRDALKISSALPQSTFPRSQIDIQELSRPEPAANNVLSSKPSERSSAEILERSVASTEPVSKNGNGAQASTTPLSTPSSKRYVDGTLSASKSKIQSIMKTARGLFASSAGVSAQAKVETLSPHATRTRSQLQGLKGGDTPRTKLKGPPADYGTASANRSEKQVVISKPQADTPTKTTEGRKTRSSTEKEEKRKEQEAKERERVDLELERAREMESRKAAAHWQEEAKVARANLNLKAEVEQAASSNDGQPTRPTRQSPRRVQTQQEPKRMLEPLENQINNVENSSINNPMAPPPNHPQAQSSQLQRPKDLRRPAKPAKETAPKSKPQPVAIRIGTLSQRIPLTNTALSSSLSESLAPPPPKQPGLAKKASNISLQTSSSSSSLKSSTTSSAPKPKALLAAERKKEQDEREAQRKLEQKRENERKRAAQQEELRRQEQAHRQEVERQRERERAVASEDPKKIAQRQAIEKRRLEVVKKEQQRQATQQAKSQLPPAINRSELGAARHPSKLHTVQDYSRPLPNQPPCNPAKPAAKRVFEPEADDEPGRPVRMLGGPSYQQTDKKRRRTEDEDVQELMVRPPIRQSNIRKDAPKQSIFSSNYSGAQQPSNHYHQSSSMVKTAALNQTYQQHQQPNQAPRPGPFNEMAKYTTGKIPFAETPNPPSKSPLRPKQPAAAPAKSSPQFVNGENIELEDIPTDSDEEDSEDEKAKGAMLADWAQSPELRKILEEQEKNANADDIFGPPGSPHMEEMFKERRDRFRSRTSSANWNGSDRLTEEEIRNDRAGRERLRKQGGWFFGL